MDLGNKFNTVVFLSSEKAGKIGRLASVTKTLLPTSLGC